MDIREDIDSLIKRKLDQIGNNNNEIYYNYNICHISINLRRTNNDSQDNRTTGNRTATAEEQQ